MEERERERKMELFATFEMEGRDKEWEYPIWEENEKTPVTTKRMAEAKEREWERYIKVK